MDPAHAAERARAIVHGRRAASCLDDHPWVLFYEGRADLADMVSGKNPPLVQFYSVAVQALERLNQVYRGLGFTYGIEHERQAAARLSRRAEVPPSLLVVSGRQPEGASVARMIRATRGRALPIYLVCESLSTVSAQVQEAMRKAEVMLLDRRHLGPEQLHALYETHLLPAFATTDSGLRIRQVAPGSGSEPQRGERVTVRCTGVLADGTLCVGTAQQGLLCTFELGSGGVPRAWEEAAAMMQPGGRSLLVAGPDLVAGAADSAPPETSGTVVYDFTLVAVGGDSLAAEASVDEWPPDEGAADIDFGGPT